MQVQARELGDSADAAVQVLYLYCFARPLSDPPEVVGIDGRQYVSALTINDVTAIWSPVPLDAFTGPTGDANLRDSSWVVPRACQHERVVEAVMRRSPVLPVRFGTVFSTPGLLEERLADWATVISRFLDDVSGKEEWSVRGFADPDRVAKWLTASAPALAELQRQTPSSPGAQYFYEKRLRVAVQGALGVWRRVVATEVAKSLSDCVDQVRVLSSWLRDDSKGPRQQVLNCTVLVPKERVAGLHTYVNGIEERYADPGVKLEVSGPWPPYSFCPSVLGGDTPVDEGVERD
jgi:hypothetical protein